MPRFLRHIFSAAPPLPTSSNPTHPTPDTPQPARRTITKRDTPRARLSLLNLSLGLHADAASLAESEARAARPMLAPSVASREGGDGLQAKRVRRRLSKRHRMPGRRD